MRLLAVAALSMSLLLPIPAGAETYTWTDDNGILNFTDDLSSIPAKYRKNVGKRGDMGGESPAVVRTTETAVKENAALPGKETGSGAQTTPLAENGLYGGRKAEEWQQEFRLREAEYKRFEQQLVQLEGEIKSPRGVLRERLDMLSQQFREVQKQYNEALRNYNELNDAANKAGLPGDFRK